MESDPPPYDQLSIKSGAKPDTKESESSDVSPSSPSTSRAKVIDPWRPEQARASNTRVKGGIVWCPSCGVDHKCLTGLQRRFSALKGDRSSEFDIGGPNCIPNQHALDLGPVGKIPWWQCHLARCTTKSTLFDFRLTDDKTWLMSAETRTKDGRLLLKVAGRTTISTSDPEAINKLSWIPTCAHRDPNEKSQFRRGTALLEIFLDPDRTAKLDPKVGFWSDFTRCSTCLTEYRIGLMSQTYNSKGKGKSELGKQTFWVAFWVDLGACESIDELAWKVVASPEPLEAHVTELKRKTADLEIITGRWIEKTGGQKHHEVRHHGSTET